MKKFLSKYTLAIIGFIATFAFMSDASAISRDPIDQPKDPIKIMEQNKASMNQAIRTKVIQSVIVMNANYKSINRKLVSGTSY